MRRWLSADAIKPWQHRSWIFPRDPDFAVKAERVLDLYDRAMEGPSAAPGDEYVISADENIPATSPAAPSPRLCRPGRDGPHPSGRVEYSRGGTLAYLAALRRAPRHRDGPLRRSPPV